MLVAAAVCPCPPMLAPQVAPDPDPELDRLRGACDSAVASLVAARPNQILTIASGDRLRTFGSDVLPVFDDITAGGAPVGTPLDLRIGASLLARHGADVPVSYQQVSGRPLEPGVGRTALLVMADGTATRSTAAPGHLDERADAYDAAIGSALARGDAEGLERLDPALGGALWSCGVPALQSLGASVRVAQLTPVAEVLYAEAPRGVAYWVATWGFRDRSPGAAGSRR